MPRSFIFRGPRVTRLEVPVALIRSRWLGSIILQVGALLRIRLVPARPCFFAVGSRGGRVSSYWLPTATARRRRPSPSNLRPAQSLVHRIGQGRARFTSLAAVTLLWTVVPTALLRTRRTVQVAPIGKTPLLFTRRRAPTVLC